jgi:hypothetical protein
MLRLRLRVRTRFQGPEAIQPRWEFLNSTTTRDFPFRGRSANGDDCDRKHTFCDNSNADISERPVVSQGVYPNGFTLKQPDILAT